MEETNLPQPREYTTGGKELCFGLGISLSALALCNFIFFGGFNLGFAIAASLCILCCTGYLLWKGRKLTFYPCAILSLCLIIAASFARRRRARCPACACSTAIPAIAAISPIT